jgi:hypothetical protein
MKRIAYLLVVLAGLVFVIVSCSDDDDGPMPNPGAPTISVSPNATDALPGEDVTFTVNATAGTGASVASITADDGSGAQNVSGGTYTYSVDAGIAGGTAIVITFTVTDDSNPPQMATTTATINVGKPTVDITDDDLQDGTYNWTADNAYLLDGLVFLEEGGVLNIEEGTVIRFKAQPTNDNASSLIITRGAQIFANGTADNPIIFTAEADDLSGLSLTPEDNGQWGGLLVLGKATAEKGGAREIQIEGIDSSEPRGLYGGDQDDDNSGSLTYISIRYTGIGFQPGDELQGLTLGGVGNGTVIDYVDIFSSADDGIEIFGGTVDIRHISVAFSTDDDFDFDLGYRGTGQFLFSLMRTDDEGYDHAGEWDGASPDDGFNSMPNIYNATFIGPGTTATGRDKALLIRENYAGILSNSIFVDFPNSTLEVQDLPAGVTDSYSKLDNDLFIKNNTWSNFNGNTDWASAIKISDGAEDATGQTLQTHLATYNNKLVAEQVVIGVSRTTDGGLDPRPAAADTEVDNDLVEGIEAVNYRGAFDPEASGTWLDGWSTLSKFGYLSN